MTTTVEDNKRIAQRIIEQIVDQGNPDAVDELYTEDAVEHTLVGDFSGREEIKESIEMSRDAFSDYTMTVEDIVAENDTVAARLTVRGTHDGEFWGIEPTHKEVQYQTMTFVRMVDGKVAEWWVQPDLLGLMRQLGASPGDLNTAMPAND